MKAQAMQKLEADGGWKHTMNPTCTGSSVFAVRYDGGVVLAADTAVSYGKMARYRNYSRIINVGTDVAVSFSGDHADFQFLEATIREKQEEYKSEMNDYSAEMSAQALFQWLSWLMYYRRSRVNPLFNVLLVAGKTTNYKDATPFLGVVNMRGVAYHPNYVATGLGAMLIQQTMENVYRAANGEDAQTNAAKMSREQGIDLMRNCIELAQYHDCCAYPEFELLIVGEGGATKMTNELPQIGAWKQLAESIRGYD